MVYTRAISTVFASALAALGLAFLFGGDELAPVVFGATLPPPVPSLLAALWLGAAAMTWTARGAVLGGIYGRAVVIGNQVHFFVGALALVNRGFSAPGPAGLAVFYIAGAACYSYLLFRASPAGASRPRP